MSQAQGDLVAVHNHYLDNAEELAAIAERGIRLKSLLVEADHTGMQVEQVSQLSWPTAHPAAAASW